MQKFKSNKWIRNFRRLSFKLVFSLSISFIPTIAFADFNSCDPCAECKICQAMLIHIGGNPACFGGLGCPECPPSGKPTEIYAVTCPATRNASGGYSCDDFNPNDPGCVNECQKARRGDKSCSQGSASNQRELSY